jgi:hypothetical protein
LRPCVRVLDRACADNINFKHKFQTSISNMTKWPQDK